MRLIPTLLGALVVPIVLIVMIAVYQQFSANVDQTDWSTSANTTLTKVNTGSWGGFSLASMLPYVIIAVAVIGLLVGAFAVLGG